MVSNFFLVIFFIFFLYLINFFLKKFNISLDRVLESENHKLLLRSDNSIPLSGTYYFLPIIFFLFYKLDFFAVIFSLFFFILGLMADLKLVNSPKLRLIIQFLLLTFLFQINKDLVINTRIDFLDNLMNYNFVRIIICSFFFMVLINGFNLIDGTNCLSTLNFSIILFFIYLLSHNTNLNLFNHELILMIFATLIFVIFNFFGKNFLGDGGAYGLGFLLGFILVKISLSNHSISPYFVANLLWYPAFENLFSIMRRRFHKKNNYLPDNNHLHQLIFKYLRKKNFIKKNFLLSSIVGIIINMYLFIVYLSGYFFYSETNVQVALILTSIALYLLFYYRLTKTSR